MRGRFKAAKQSEDNQALPIASVVTAVVIVLPILVACREECQ